MTKRTKGLLFAVLAVAVLAACQPARAANLGDVLGNIAHSFSGPDAHNYHSPMRVNDGTGVPFGLHELEQSTLHNITGHGGNIIQNVERAAAIMEAERLAGQVLHGAGPIVESLTHHQFPQQGPEGGYYGDGGGFYNQPHPYAVPPHGSGQYGNPYENHYGNPYGQRGW